MELYLAFLGGFRIMLNGEPVRGFVSDKARALLCYLVMEQREHRRSDLAALLWSEMPETKARTNLRQALANLRHLLGPYLEITRHAVAFNHRRAYSLDVETFEKAAAAFHRSGETSLGEQAATLYQGDFLSGICPREAPAFDEWAVIQREQLHRIAIDLFYRLAARFYNRGAYETALPYLDTLLALEPWREEAHRQRMMLLARLGQFGAAIKQYETCRRLLRSELDVSPSAETITLYRRIRRLQEHPLVERGLPLQPTPFIGRQEEIDELVSLLAVPHERLVSILGPGGTGKTRLALETARRVRHLFLEGVTFLSLASLTTPHRLPDALLAALNLSTRDRPLVALLDELRHQERLLLLDNFEHLLQDGDTALKVVAAILENAPQVKILVTSRLPLHLRWERRFVLQGMPCPPEPLPDAPQNYAAIRLFLNQARRIRPDFRPTRSDFKAIARICRLVDGLPLALELAATWTRQISCTRIADVLHGGMEEPTSPMVDFPSRQRSLQATFAYTWDLLSSEERRVFREITVFRGGFSLQAAQEVVGASPDLLVSLAEKFLLRETQARYDLHEMLRAYGLEHLRRSGDVQRLRRRHLTYFRSLAQEAALHLQSEEQAAWVARLKIEMANLRAALQFAWEARHGVDGLHLIASLWPFWDIIGALSEGRQWLERLLPLAPDAPPDVRAQALGGVGVLAWRQADFEAASAYQRESLAILRQLGDEAGVARALANLAMIALDSGYPERAASIYQESLTLFRQLGDVRNLALALNNMGVIALHRHDLYQAQTFFNESLHLYRQMNQPRGISWALGNLGNVSRYRGDYERAATYYAEALIPQQDLGDRWAIALTRSNLGHARALQGMPESALDLYRQALTALQELNAMGDVAETLERMAAAYLDLGHTKRTVQLLQQAAALRRQYHVPISNMERPYLERTLKSVQVQFGKQDEW